MVHCFLKIWFNTRTHPNESWNGQKPPCCHSWRHSWQYDVEQNGQRPISYQDVALCLCPDVPCTAYIRQLAHFTYPFKDIIHKTADMKIRVRGLFTYLLLVPCYTYVGWLLLARSEMSVCQRRWYHMKSCSSGKKYPVQAKTQISICIHS